MTADIQAANHAAYTLGWNDGYEMASESGSAEAPADGWDGCLINAVGPTRVGELLNEDPDSAGWYEALAEYNRGAQDGADNAVAELTANN